MPAVIWTAAAAVVVVAAFAWLFNGLVGARKLARQGLTDLDAQLRRRADLVPRMVAAVHAYTSDERALLTSVSELRAGAQRTALPAARFELERKLGERVRQLVLLRESYPELEADADFRDLAQELMRVEDALQQARRAYNAAVRQYMTRIESLPGLIAARAFGFRAMPYFESGAR